MEKQCTKCLCVKAISEFSRQKLGKFGVTSKCRPCVNKMNSDWQKANREKASAKVRNWRAKNAESVRENGRQYYYATKDARIASVIKWQKRNPESKAFANAKYRSNNPEALRAWRKKNRQPLLDHAKERESLKRSATPKWLTDSERFCMKEIYRMSIRVSRCTGIKHHVDHIHPLKSKSVCGLHVPWNLRVISARLNLKKGTSLERSCY